MTDKFLKNMQRLFESGSAGISLKMILEEEEKEDPFDDAFSDEGGDDESDEEEASDNEDSPGDEEPEEEPGASDSDDAGSSEGAVFDDIHALKNSVDVIDSANFAKQQVKDKYTFPVNITGKIVADAYNVSLKIHDLVLLSEDADDIASDTLSQVEDTLSKEEERIKNISDKANYLSSKATSGQKVNTLSYAKSATSDFEHFDSIFNKAEIVANSYINQIVDISAPDSVEANIKAFLEEFNKMLPSDQKIDIQEKPASYNAMAGAKPTA